jgi:hypothetical protein
MKPQCSLPRLQVPALDSILNNINPVNTFPHTLTVLTTFIIIILSTPRFYKLCLSLRYSDQNFVGIFASTVRATWMACLILLDLIILLITFEE